MSNLDVNVDDGGISGGEGEQQQQQTKAVPQEILDEAMADGWKPLDQYNGPEERWVDAETFVKRGREINPILRKNNERLQAEIKALKDQLDTTNMSLKQVQEYHSQLEERAYARAVKDLKAKRREAFVEGDNATVVDIEEEIEELEKNKPKPRVDETPKPPPKGEDPILADWMQEHKGWFNDSNPEMMDYANAVGIRLRRNDPENKIVGKAFLDKITEAVKKQFPEKFGSRRSGAAMVEGSSNGTGSSGAGGGGTKLADLPPEARKACKELSTEKWYIDLAKAQGLTPEQLYIKDYGV